MLLLGLGVLPALAATRVLTMDGLTDLECDAPWTEANLTLEIVDTTADDHTAGVCIVFDNVNGPLLYGARLVVDLSTVSGVETVEVHYQQEPCAEPGGCTRAYLYNDGEIVFTHLGGTDDGDVITTLTAGGPVDTIAVSAIGAIVKEIRIIGDDLIPAAAQRWSVVKSLY
jgi:hypothetical protein